MCRNGIINRLQTFQNKLVRNESNKLAVRGAFTAYVHSCAENRTYRVRPTPVPRNFYCVADSSFNLTRSSCKLFRNFGIKFFGYFVYNRRVVYRKLYALAKIRKAFDIGRNAYRYKNVAYLFVKRTCLAFVAHVGYGHIIYRAGIG